MSEYRVSANNISATDWTIVAWNYTGYVDGHEAWYSTAQEIPPGGRGIVDIWMCDDNEFDLYLLARNGNASAGAQYKYSKKRHIKPDCGEPGCEITVQIV